MLDKRLQLGGLQVGGPRTMQNSARFRVANNVYQSLDEYMIRRFGNKEYVPDLPTDQTVVAISKYNLKPFFITQDGEGKYHYYYDSAVELPTSKYTSFLVLPEPGDNLSMGIQFIENLGCLYFNLPILGLMKFDGFQVYRAGVYTPWINCGNYSDTGATFVRVIQHHIDFQGNVINSGYLQFPATPAANNISIQVDQTALDLMSSSSILYFYNRVTPKGRLPFDGPGNGNDNFYAISNGPPIYSGVEATIPTGGNHYVETGAYLLVSTSYLPSYASGFGVETFGSAFKVVSQDATSITVTTVDAKYLDASRLWNTVDAFSVPAPSGGVLCNLWLSVWTSNVETGNYVWKAILPAPFFSTTTQTYTVDVSNPTVPAINADKTAFNLAGNLGDIYDVLSVKHPFPALEEGRPSISFCMYGEMALIGQINEVYYSDTTLGGSFEMSSGIAFAAIGGGDDGPIQAVQGTSDFFLVSRQFKNYYVSGNLPTANYRVQSISQTALGVYSNEATVSCLDKIIFVNKTGVWALYSGGKCVEASINIRGLFETFSKTKDYPEEDYFNFRNYPTYVVPSQLFREEQSTAYNKWLRVKFDVSRNLVFIILAGEEKTGNFLVLNMSNGEFYTWRDVLYGVEGPNFQDICFIEGNYYITANSADGNSIRKEEKEDPLYKYTYDQGNFPPRLTTTWFTAGEPSLEKKINQLKMWGTSVGEVEIRKYLDWRNIPNNEGTYLNSDQGLFSHKKRVEGANALAVSMDLIIRATEFELEGLELEFHPFQMGMKR